MFFPNSVEFPNIDMVIPHTGVPSVTASYTVFGFVYLPFLHKGGTNSVPDITVNSVFYAHVLYFDGTTASIPNDELIIHGNFGQGNVCLRVDIPSTSIPNIADNKPLLIHLRFSATVKEPVS